MTLISECLTNVETALAELKAAILAESAPTEPVTNQSQENMTDRELLELSNIRF